MDVLVEAIQGPCKANQKAMVTAKIFDSCREYIAGFERPAELELLGITDDDDLGAVQEFKNKIMTLLMSLIEGEVDLDIMMRMAFSLDMSVLKARMLNVFTTFAQETLGREEINIKDLNLNLIQSKLKRDSFEGTINEAFQIYILMNSLKDSLEE